MLESGGGGASRRVRYRPGAVMGRALWCIHRLLAGITYGFPRTIWRTIASLPESSVRH
jgi:hypothetical protein